MTDGAGVGLYGKVASQPDFLRAGAGTFSQAGLDRWLQEGVEALRADRTVLPAVPIAFLLAPHSMTTAFVGVLAASADAAGRSFPLALFVETSTAQASETLPSLPAAYAPFVSEGSALLATAANLDGAEIARRVLALDIANPVAPLPHAWKNEPVRTLATAFGGSLRAVAYALRTLLAACDRSAEAAATPATGALTVDAPTPRSAVGALWLEIARGRLSWSNAVPSLLWTDGPDGRLLLTLGPPAPSALAFLANPRHRSSRLWPLRTGVASAADQAWAALTSEQQRAIQDPDALFGDLASAFA